MNEIKKATDNLVNVILESDICKEYRRCQDEMNRYPELKKRTDEFRSKNFQLQNIQADVYDGADRLLVEYKDILENQLVRSYLNAENTFCKVIQQINYRLIEELDFEVDFLS